MAAMVWVEVPVGEIKATLIASIVVSVDSIARAVVIGVHVSISAEVVSVSVAVVVLSIALIVIAASIAAPICRCSLTDY